MEVFIFALFVAALALGLERNHARQTLPRSPMTGSSDAQDRDLERVVKDLRTC